MVAELTDTAVAERRELIPGGRAPLPTPWTAEPRPFPGRGLLKSLRHALDERRLFVLLPFAVIVGLVASTMTPEAPEPLLLGGGGALLLAALVLAARSLAVTRCLALLAAFWVGFSLLAIHAALFGTPMLVRPVYGSYQMRIDDILTESADGMRAVVSGIVPADGARVVPMRRARIVIEEAGDLSPGDTIRGPVRFYAVPGPVVPNGFDTQFHAFFDGIGAYGSTTGTVQRTATGSDSAPERVVDSIRRGIAARIDAVLAQPAAGIARALITGDQSAVTEAARETMATAGLAHVLSVSGLHLTLVALLVMGTLRGGLALWGRLDRMVPVKRLAAAGAILASLGYFAISGGNVAALRSTIMILLMLGAVVFGRRALTMRNVAIAALIIILVDPASVFRPSFQLSFAAVVALIGVWEMLPPPDGKQKSIPARVGAYLGGIILTSLVAGLATVLFSIYHFQQTSPLGLLGNLFSLPLVGFVMMPAAVLATLAMPLGMEAPFLAVMGWSIDRMLDLAAVVAALSGAINGSPLLAPVALGLGLAAIAWFAFFKTWHRFVGPALLAPAVVLLALDQPPDVLIADTTQAIAIRGTEGLGLVAGKGESFAVDVWRETYAEQIPAAALLTCDKVGCFGNSPLGFSVALIKDVAGFYEDCALADLVIARQTAPISCSAPAIIDSAALARGGVHWLKWHADTRSFEVRPAIGAISRPWRVSPP